MLKRVVLLVGCLLLAVSYLQAQVDAQLAYYWELPAYYNPASVARDGATRVSAASRQQWVGMTNAPQTFLVAADMPLKLFGKEHGIGVMMSNETIGLYTNLNAMFQYAYKIEESWGNLSIGVGMGIFQQNFDATGIIIPEDSDAHNTSEEGIPTSELQGLAFDMGLGVYYTYDNYYVGLSTTHLMESTINFDETYESYLARGYYLMGGGNIQLKNSLFQIHPSFFVKSIWQTTQYEFTLRTTYNNLFIGGLSYRPSDAVVLLLGAEMKNIRLGYAYEYPISEIVNVSSGSHEVFVSYKVTFDLSKTNENSHRSIRIL